ncbi:MAG: response regulator [Rhodobiaceae bacterium]|nr:response regulator [Rhodobiaceae bacterium]
MAKILIAEDDESMRETVRRALLLAGHEVTAVHNGAEALHALRGGFAAGLLLADIKMPVMDGIELALAVARDKPELPILLMTGYADQGARASGLEALIHGVLVKPFSLETLRQAVSEALAGAAG